MLNTVTSIAHFFWEGLKYLLEFLLILLLGALGAILYAIPWLLRTASVLIWLVAGYLATTVIHDLYSHSVSSPIPVLALQFAIIVLMAGWAMVGMMQKGKNTVWGLFATSGIVVGGFFSSVVPWMFGHWPYESGLIFRVLPSALSMVLLVAMTLRLKWLRSTGSLKLSTPAFVMPGRQELIAENADAQFEEEGSV